MQNQQHALLVQLPYPPRRSGRVAGNAPENYAEDELFRSAGLDRLDLMLAPRRCSARTHFDAQKLAILRAACVREAGEVDPDAVEGELVRMDAAGRGVRVQGGRIYDSQFGVTCHWCRQKTLEDHVTCTAEGCGGGRKLPVSFW